MPYSEFIDYLRKKKVVSHKRQGEGNECSYNFLFESMENNVTFMLDVSPYMVNYNYGTNSLSLASLQLLVRHLLGSLLQRAKDNSEFNYRVSIYLFSVYGDSPQVSY